MPVMYCPSCEERTVHTYVSTGEVGQTPRCRKHNDLEEADA
ncbi:hypothetical protein [Halobacterium salinarum]|nr:hypothetical protein [Halobacterium salinarum]MDL0133549.1 hypothetical protein [Halobacterium salinarum]